MRKMKATLKKRSALALFPLFFTALFFVFMMYSAAEKDIDIQANQKDYSDYEKLQQIAASKGKVRVIVELDVANIKELTAESNRFCTPAPGKESAWGGELADMALNDAITFVTDSVLHNLNGTDYQVTHTYSFIPYVALAVSAEALEILAYLPEVLAIQEDIPLKLIEPLPGDNQQAKDGAPGAAEVSPPRLDNTVNIIGASNAWSMGYSGSGWYVAILDTGIRSSHEFFTGKTIVEACYALGEDGIGPAGDCPNGLTSQTGAGSAVHYPSTYAGYDHGTHVSGIAAGNYGSLFGVARDANIIAVQIFSKFNASPYCGGGDCVLSWSSDQLAGLDYVYSIRGSYSIAAVNMSLGGGAYSSACDSDSRKAAIDNLRAAGIATAIATGNDGYCGSVSAPSCISTCVSVGSSTDGDAESYFNNWHATMQELFAPGSSVYSSTGASDSSYGSWSGTSMATPHVTGAWAVIKQAKPTGTVDEILNGLQSAGIGITSVCDGYTTPIPRIKIDSVIFEINVKFKSKNIANGATLNAGTLTLAAIVGKEVRFTIENLGIAQSLGLTGAPDMVTLAGPDAKYFTVTQQPLTNTIGPGASTPFKIRTKTTTIPTVPDGWTKNVEFTVNIPNTDPDEAPYSFTIRLTVVK